MDYPHGLIEAVRGAGLEVVPISADHAELAPTPLPHHRDPFDRMLVAQAQRESLTFATADEQLSLCDVEVLDATS